MYYWEMKYVICNEKYESAHSRRWHKLNEINNWAVIHQLRIQCHLESAFSKDRNITQSKLF